MNASAVASPVDSFNPNYLEEDPIETLRRLPIFQGLSDAEAKKIKDVSEVVDVEQDLVIPRSGDKIPPSYCLLIRGQVAFAEFEKGKVPPPPANKKKKPTPVMQVCERVVAIFDAGELFKDDHVESTRGEDGVLRDMALFTCIRVRYLRIPQAALETILPDTPVLRETIDAKAEEAYYRQTLLKLDGRSDLLDFYVKNGFEYARAIKVIQTDKCIDCDECVRACETRHGISRIERFGPRVGLLQFTLNCRTCHDPRCVEVCNFDAITLGKQGDAEEVVVYENCVGCMKCSKACPHQAIRMVDVEQPEELDLVKAVEEQKDRPLTRVAKGEENKGKAKKKPKRLANKCDHCFGYSDMACISACPTGAIIQIDPRELFRRDGGLIQRADKYFDTEPFRSGWSQALGFQGVKGMMVLFFLSAVFVFASYYEYLARKYFPELALQSFAFPGDVITILSPVYGFLRWMGYLGAGMMTLAALYTLRLHVPILRRIGNSRTWFDFHVVFGIAGPLLILLHTDFAIFAFWSRPLVTLLWWATFGIVVSGLIGRFFYTALPRLESLAERERKKLDAGIRSVADEWSSLTVSDNVMAKFMKAQQMSMRAAVSEDSELTTYGAFMSLIKSELGRIGSQRALRNKTMGGIKNKKLREEALKLIQQRSGVERKRRLFSLAKRLLAQWRGIHIAVTITMFVLLFCHVVIAVYTTGLGI